MTRSLPPDGTRVVPSKFAHAVFRAKRYDEMVAWWKNFLQAEVAFGNPMLTFLTFDDEHHRIAIGNAASLEERPPQSTGLDHIAYTLATLGDLLYSYRRLKKDGVEPYWCVNHGPTTSLYYRDPEGNGVELQVDNFPSVEALKGWFRSAEFSKNPIGVNFDPEKLLAKYLDGVPESELVKQGSA